jgi:hypothetical protein
MELRPASGLAKGAGAGTSARAPVNPPSRWHLFVRAPTTARCCQPRAICSGHAASSQSPTIRVVLAIATLRQCCPIMCRTIAAPHSRIFCSATPIAILPPHCPDLSSFSAPRHHASDTSTTPSQWHMTACDPALAPHRPCFSDHEHGPDLRQRSSSTAPLPVCRAAHGLAIAYFRTPSPDVETSI